MILQAAGEIYPCWAAGEFFETPTEFPAWRVFDTILFKSYILPALNITIILFST